MSAECLLTLPRIGSEWGRRAERGEAWRSSAEDQMSDLLAADPEVISVEDRLVPDQADWACPLRFYRRRHTSVLGGSLDASRLEDAHSAHYDAGWTAAKNVRPCRTAGAPGDASVCGPAIDDPRPPQAQGQPRWKSVGRVVDCPAQLGPFVLGHAPLRFARDLSVCPPRPGTASGRAIRRRLPRVTSPHPVDLRVRQLRFPLRASTG